MMRDRMRTEVESQFLQLLGEVTEDRFDASRLTITTFAATAGLSRQALHKSHPAIARAILLLADALKPPVQADADLARRVTELNLELADTKKQLHGAVTQNHELCAQILQLQKRLKTQRLKVVPISGLDGDDGTERV